jgi:hypothetical protein
VESKGVDREGSEFDRTRGLAKFESASQILPCLVS